MSKQAVTEEQQARLRRIGAQKGEPSRNPGGRPKTPEHLKQAFQAAAPQALATLLECIHSESSRWADKNRAAEIILNRGYGMPTQSVQVDSQVTFNWQAVFADYARLPQQEPAAPIVIEAETITPKAKS